MSATADISRYKGYFKDLGRDERVEVVAIPSSNQKTNFERRVIYLEQAFTCPIYLKFSFCWGGHRILFNRLFCLCSSHAFLLLYMG